MPKYIAVAGKGGTGKTTFASLIVKYLIQNKMGTVLAVDADPNANLSEVLGMEVKTTISELLEQTKDPKSVPVGMSKEVFIEYKLQQSLVESKNVDLLVMGNPQGAGCYCYPNDLLRKYLERLSSGYDYVVVDNEAGLEHISRKTIPHVDWLFVISDASARGIRSAGRVHELVRSLGSTVKEELLIVTKTKTDSLVNLEDEINATGIKLIGDIPYDEAIATFDEEGKALFELPDNNMAVNAAKKILIKAGI
ncbi:MAG: carbon monoxide dehydrogenase [Peptococcaceae bacterium BICA1-8]|nr:MAG: carbon monoxide dehydrogenase [Peptococcaceae bacterium BICA1-8]